jgi:hypothetical protein
MPFKTAEMIEVGLHLTSLGLAVAGLATGALPLAGIGAAIELIALGITGTRLAEESLASPTKNTNPVKTDSALLVENQPQAITGQAAMQTAAHSNIEILPVKNLTAETHNTNPAKTVSTLFEKNQPQAIERQKAMRKAHSAAENALFKIPSTALGG